MSRERFSVGLIINHLREAEVLLTQGQTVGEIRRPIGVSEQSCRRSGREPGGLKVEQVRCLKQPEQEHARLMRAATDSSV